MSTLDMELDELILHRGRMRLVEQVVQIGEDWCATRAVVRESWPLLAGGTVSALVTVELVAQTAAVLVGWERREMERMGGRGFIAGIRRASWPEPRLPLGMVLTTRIDRTLVVENYAVFHGKVRSAGGLVGEVELQAVRPTEESPSWEWMAREPG